MTTPKTVILGAGPAGLSAAYRLTLDKAAPLVLEKEPVAGGISRTETHGGYGFDLGGHRFFTRIPEVKKLWFEVMGTDFLNVKRKSRILYQNRFLHYPLQLPNLMGVLGPREAFLCLAGYLKSRLFPRNDTDTLEGWIINRFGERLFRLFFEPYSEKVWGRPCREICSHWSAQRIRTLSFHRALSDVLFKTGEPRSLAREFFYPAKGAGMMWERMRRAVMEGPGSVRLSARIVGLKCAGNRIERVLFHHGGRRFSFPVAHLISTIPLISLVTLLEPRAPSNVLEACRFLAFRALVVVMLVLDREDLFPDQWIYVQDGRFRVGRLQNFKQWSPHLVPNPRTTSVGMEYFCDPFDTFFNTPDPALIDFAAEEMTRLGLSTGRDILDGTVRRVPYAYPIYDMGYDTHLQTIQTFLNRYKNLQSIGRNGMHAYNNMDMAAHSGLLAAQNVLGASHDLWHLLKKDKQYLE